MDQRYSLTIFSLESFEDLKTDDRHICQTDTFLKIFNNKDNYQLRAEITIDKNSNRQTNDFRHQFRYLANLT